ncbi:MAG: DUF998 domain-containing protein [Promethearchaeota archaeon]
MVDEKKLAISFSEFERKSIFLGMLGPSIILLGFLISGLFFKGFAGESYSILNHFVSELGIPSISPLALAFNLGLIIGGTLTVTLMFSLRKILRTNIGFVIGLTSGVGAVLVGFFPATEQLLLIHAIVAMIFFFGGMITIFIFSIVIIINKNHGILPRWLSYFGFTVAGIFAVFLIFSFSGDVNFSSAGDFFLHRPPVLMSAFLEWLTVVSITIWLLLAAIVSHQIDRNIKE